MAALRRKCSLCRECGTILQQWRRSPWRSRPSPSGSRSASTEVANRNRPFRVAIIGSGPAGFYSALRIIQKLEGAVVDMYEQLPTPFGLVRYGVAPDHPEVKNCQDRFEEVASSPRFNFIGNVTVGDEIPLRSLQPHYDALLFAYGASQDKTLGILGEQLNGIYSARAFVGWYNGLPEYEHLQPNLQAGENAAVIGNGNVALDIARILLSDVDSLRKTDISEQALEALSKSRVKRVYVCGRRGPMQAAFTIKELRELFSLPNIGFQPLDEHLLPNSNWISRLPRLEQRKYRFSKLLSQGSETSVSDAGKSWSLTSLVSPKSFNAKAGSNPDHLNDITMTKNVFQDDDDRFSPSASVTSTDDTIVVEASLAFRSIGYKSAALTGLTSQLGVPFDERTGIIPNDMQGRIINISKGPGPLNTTHIPGCYCAGWVKRGPTGVIASTMEDAFASADVLRKDWMDEVQFMNGSTRAQPRGSGMGWEGVLQENEVKGKSDIRRVSWADWKKIDMVERERGRTEGKPREKIRTIEEMLRVLD